MKSLILGHKDHGKDEFAIHTGLNFGSSTKCALEEFLFVSVNNRIENRYSSIDEMYINRDKHRPLMYRLIEHFNRNDGARLVKKVLTKHDGYIGLRSNYEFTACMDQDLFSAVYWVDGSKRKPMEPSSSMTIEYDPSCMIYIDNNGDLDNLKRQAISIGDAIRNTQ